MQSVNILPILSSTHFSPRYSQLSGINGISHAHRPEVVRALQKSLHGICIIDRVSDDRVILAPGNANQCIVVTMNMRS